MQICNVPAAVVVVVAEDSSCLQLYVNLTELCHILRKVRLTLNFSHVVPSDITKIYCNFLFFRSFLFYGPILSSNLLRK